MCEEDAPRWQERAAEVGGLQLVYFRHLRQAYFLRICTTFSQHEGDRNPFPSHLGLRRHCLCCEGYWNDSSAVVVAVEDPSSKVQGASGSKVTFDPAPFCLPYPVNPMPLCLPYPVPYPVMWGNVTGRGLTCQAFLQRDRACYHIIRVFPGTISPTPYCAR